MRRTAVRRPFKDVAKLAKTSPKHLPAYLLQLSLNWAAWVLAIVIAIPFLPFILCSLFGRYVLEFFDGIHSFIARYTFRPLLRKSNDMFFALNKKVFNRD